MENRNLKSYPDLIITKKDDSENYIEFERTQKLPGRFKKKLDGHTKWPSEGGQIYWITPTQTLANWIATQINNYVWQELNTHEIWNNKE